MTSKIICCVPNCGSITETLHLFPNPSKDPERFRTWKHNIGGDIVGLNNDFIYKNRRVCHLHFEAKYHTRSKYLTVDVIPQLCLRDDVSVSATKMDHEKICRVCLNFDQGTCTEIFNKSDDETFIYENLNLIANINIKPKDGLPDKICSDCLSELENAIIFKQKCETSNNILVSALQTNIGLLKQDNESPEVPLEEECDEYNEKSEVRHEYEEYEYEEEPPSPPELTLKFEGFDELKELPSPTELTLKPGEFDKLEELPSPPKRKLKSEELDKQEELPKLSELTMKPEYLGKHEEPPSPPELTLNAEEPYKLPLQPSLRRLALRTFTNKSEKPYKKEQPLNPLKTHLESPSRPSRAIDQQFECHDCGSLFKSKCKMKVHWFKIHLKAQLTCNICGNTFGSFNKFKEHKINRTKRCLTMGQVRIDEEGRSRMYHCKQCPYSTKYIETMTKHLAVHSGERDYTCTLCAATFIYLNSLDAHMESKHGVLRKTIVCNICGEKFGHRAFYSHIRKHRAGDSAKCNICNKVLKYKSYMKDHMKRHAGVKKHACDKCGKSFSTSSDLGNHRSVVHERKHLDNTYNCDVCEFMTHYKKNMRKHKQNHSNYDYVCTKCGKFFDNATQLSCHEEKHINNYPCQHCEKTYFTRKQLVRHMNTFHNISAKKKPKK